MRCNIKVAYRDSVIHPDRRTVVESSKDSTFCREWFLEWVRQYDDLMVRMDTEQKPNIPKRAVRSVERALRYDGWAWVSFTCVDGRDADGTAFVRCSVSVDNVNHAPEECGIPAAARDVARFLAETVVHLREGVAVKHDAEARNHVRWDSSDVYFRIAEREEDAYWRRKRVDALRVSGVSVCPSLMDDGTCKAGAACRCVKCKDGVCADAEVVTGASAPYMDPECTRVERRR